MLYPGMRVTHNQFPPVTGQVVGFQEFLGGDRKVSVLNDATGTLFYDFENTWDEIPNHTPSFEYRYADGHGIGWEDDTVIIDADFEVID